MADASGTGGPSPTKGQDFLARALDVRAGEGPLLARAFGTLFLLIAGHTLLETARDALFLAKLPATRLAFVYGVLALLGIFASAYSARFVRRFGRRSALVVSLTAVAFGSVALFLRPITTTSVLVLYIFSGLAGAVLAAQFWMVAGHIFTAAQGRRLFGPLAAGGVLGAVAGAGGAVLLLSWLRVSTLLLVSGGLFLAAAFVATSLPAEDAPSGDFLGTRLEPGRPTPPVAGHRPLQALGRSPYLTRVALLVGLSTATVLAADYLFKATAARMLTPAQLGPFFARYYALLNGLALVVQVGVASRVVRRVGVVGAVTILPVLLAAGGIVTFLTGGTFLVVLLTKGVDGTLRHSLHRVTFELLWMPVSAEERDASKGFVDTVLGRAVQAGLAVGILGLTTLGWASPQILGALVTALAVVWIGVAAGLAKPYLGVFRQAIARGTLDAVAPDIELDLTSVEALLEALSSREPPRVLAAMELLAQRRRHRLIPALVLYHESDEVLTRALTLFGLSDRRDWIPLAERLATKGSHRVRIAALRALARAGVAEPLRRAADDEDGTVRALAAFHLAHMEGAWSEVELEAGKPVSNSRIRAVLDAEGATGHAARAALLEAIADAPDPRDADLVLALAADPHLTALVARAMARLGSPRFLPHLLARLAFREGRDEVRSALVSFGEPAFVALEKALRDPACDARLRIHIPRTLARFPTQRAVDVLTERLTTETDGLTRYKALRGLGYLLNAEPNLRVDRPRIEREMQKNLVEYLRLLALKVPLMTAHGRDAERAGRAGRLVVGLLDDKLRQAMERAFRLLQLLHRSEDIRSVYLALRSGDKRIRANAQEFIQALSVGSGARTPRNDGGRDLLHLVCDDLADAERVARGRRVLTDVPSTDVESLSRLLRDQDATLAALAAYHALELRITTLNPQVAALRREDREGLVDRILGVAPFTLEPTGVGR